MRFSLALTLALTGALLPAQDITGGLHTGLSLPVGDLKDKSDFGTNQFFGAHVGGHLDFNLTSHHQVRAQLTFQDFPGSHWSGATGYQNDFRMLQAGADWVYHFQNPNQGWYTIAGATVNSLKDDWEYTNGAGRRISSSASQSGQVGVRGGGGFTFNRMFSLEGTLNQVFVSKGGSDGFGFDTATWVQASAVFRFGR
jgi:outer membrane protease